MRAAGLLLAALTAANVATSVTAETPAAIVVVRAARLIDGRGGAPLSPAMVRIEGDGIAEVGSRLALPPGSRLIDLGDATLLPGFIDAHTHVTMMNSDDWKQRELDILQKPIAEQALDATVNAKITLMAGMTTVRDVGSHDYIDVGLRNAIRNGRVPGPRMLVSVHAIGSTG